jgi:hypothetical protein
MITNEAPSKSKTTWQQIMTGAMPETIVDYPRYDASGKAVARIGIRLLRHQEQIDIQKAALYEADRKVKDEVAERAGKWQPRTSNEVKSPYEQLFENIQVKHLVFKFTFDPETPEKKPFFTTVDEVGLARNDEIAVLCREYAVLNDMQGAMHSTTDPAKWDEWIDGVLSDPDQAPYFLASSQVDLPSLLLTYMAKQLSTFRKSKSVSGSPANESSP